MLGQRTIITLPQEDKAWLEEYSKLHGISMAEGVRNALKLLREKKQQSTYQALLKQTRGLWNQGDGLLYQQTIRSEWEESA